MQVVTYKLLDAVLYADTKCENRRSLSFLQKRSLKIAPAKEMTCIAMLFIPKVDNI